MPYADLERIPEVIAVAGGEAETEALRAVQRGRAVRLVADSDVATKLLGQDPPTYLPPPMINTRHARSGARAVAACP
jgi:hypothetical protein